MASKTISTDAPGNTQICFAKINSYTDYDDGSDASVSVSGGATVYVSSNRPSVKVIVQVCWLYI